jgi:chromosome segregation ATPase
MTFDLQAAIDRATDFLADPLDRQYVEAAIRSAHANGLESGQQAEESATVSELRRVLREANAAIAALRRQLDEAGAERKRLEGEVERAKRRAVALVAQPR